MSAHSLGSAHVGQVMNGMRNSNQKKHLAANAPTVLYPEMKQRGFYSDVLNPENKEQLMDVSIGASVRRDVLYDVGTEPHSPYVMTFSTGRLNAKETVDALKAMNQAPDPSDFLLSTYQPKLQLSYFTPPGHCPRKIKIERARQEYGKLDLITLLAEFGIKTTSIMPKNLIDHGVEGNAILLNANPDNPAPFIPFLPLELFDNTEYDCREICEWAVLGIDVDGVQRPVPGKALLPTRDDFRHLGPRDPMLEYQWFDVGMLNYDATSKLFFVQKLDAKGRVRDADGNQIIDGALDDNGTVKEMPNRYCVPRIRLMFKAENPRIFAGRMAEAFRTRSITEALLRYHLYVDCMPMEGVGELDQASLKRMTDWAKGAPSLARDKELDDYIQVLEKEVNIDFCRSMNQIIFDTAVIRDPETFAFVTLPEPACEIVPVRGCFFDVPDYQFDDQFQMFAFNTLLGRVEVGDAISKVRAECNKVSAMSLFHIPTTKSMRIEEFEQTQSQATAQVSLFLKDSFISTLRVAIKTSLRDITKGWFNLHESNFEVYQISKKKKVPTATLR